MRSFKLWSAITGVALVVALVLTFLPYQVNINTDGLLSISLQQTHANPDWLTGWSYRKSHVINNATGAGADYQKQITIHYASPYYIADDGDGWVQSARNTPSACYYNGYTYVVYQGPKDTGDGDPYITRYCHATEVWDTPVKVGTNNAHSGSLIACPAVLVRTDTDHVGKIMVVWGGDATGGSLAAMQWDESNNAEEITADNWDSPASVGSTGSQWYNLVQAGSGGDIYLFYYNVTDFGTYDRGYRKMTAGGSTWGSAVEILQASGSPNYCIVSGMPAYNSSSGIFYFPMIYADQVASDYTYYYLIGFKPSDGKIYDIAGNSSTVPVAKSTLDNASYKFQVFAATDEEETLDVPSVALDSSGYPHTNYAYSSNDGSTWIQRYVYWTGSAWSSPSTITDKNAGVAKLFWNGVNDIDVFGDEFTTLDYYKFHWNGATWSKTKILDCSDEPDTWYFTNTVAVKDYQDVFKVLWCNWDELSTRTNQRLYAYGDSGIVYAGGVDSDDDVYLDARCRTDFGDVRFTDNDGSTLLPPRMESKVDSDYAVFWVKVADSLESAPQTIYVYCGKADATYPYLGDPVSDQAHGEATFPFFDHFDVDLTKWVTGGSPSIASSILTLDASLENVRTSGTYGTGTALRSRMYFNGDLEVGEINIMQYGDWATFNSMCRLSEDQSPYLTKAGSYNDAGTGEETSLGAFERAYAIYEIRRNATTSVIFAKDDSVLATHTTRVGTLARYIGFYCIANAEPILVDWVLIRKFVSPEPTHGAWGEWEGINPEITNSPDSWAIGVVAVGSTSNTTINYFTLNNTGNCAVDVTIQGTDLTDGDDTWALSSNATPGTNIYGLYAGKDDADDLFDVVVNTTASAFVADLAEAAIQAWGLNLTMPTSVTNYDAQQMSGTVTLVVSAA